MPERSNPKGPSSKAYKALGAMSGSSLDGLDLALCEFRLSRGRWAYRIERARTVRFPEKLQARLATAMEASAFEHVQLDAELGAFIGQACRRFLKGDRVDVIGSHGHTIFHQPSLGFSTQIGSGARIAAEAGAPVVCDFRSADVANGGQGAPLVPLAERLIFPEHRAFLNIGGICNVSIHSVKKVLGFDACIGNQALNQLANEAGAEFDRDGRMARRGTIHNGLLDRLSRLPFHAAKPPKSLGREWFVKEVLPLINERGITLEDRLRTVTEHIAIQVASALPSGAPTVLITGGGARNRFLLERIAAHAKPLVEVPTPIVIDFKESLAFALLAVLRLRGEPTALASVTGAKRDSCGGALHLPY